MSVRIFATYTVNCKTMPAGVGTPVRRLFTVVVFMILMKLVPKLIDCATPSVRTCCPNGDLHVAGSAFEMERDTVIYPGITAVGKLVGVTDGSKLGY